MHLGRLILAFSLVALLVCEGRGETQAWGCVVYGNQGEGPSDPRLKSFLPQLRRVFGYKRFDVLGSSFSEEKTDRQTWIAPTKEFYLQMIPTADSAPSQPTFDISLWQNKEVLMKARVIMPTEQPLFIRVSEHADGELLLVAALRRR